MEEARQRGSVATDDSLGGLLELRSRRGFTSQSFDVFHELGPTVETVLSGECKLRVGEPGSGLLHDFLGLFPILLQIGATRKRFYIHANVPFMRLESALV